jgi:hypothetical protein
MIATTKRENWLWNNWLWITSRYFRNSYHNHLSLPNAIGRGGLHDSKMSSFRSCDTDQPHGSGTSMKLDGAGGVASGTLSFSFDHFQDWRDDPSCLRTGIGELRVTHATGEQNILAKSCFPHPKRERYRNPTRRRMCGEEAGEGREGPSIAGTPSERERRKERESETYTFRQIFPSAPLLIRVIPRDSTRAGSGFCVQIKHVAG